MPTLHISMHAYKPNKVGLAYSCNQTYTTCMIYPRLGLPRLRILTRLRLVQQPNTVDLEPDEAGTEPGPVLQLGSGMFIPCESILTFRDKVVVLGIILVNV